MEYPLIKSLKTLPQWDKPKEPSLHFNVTKFEAYNDDGMTVAGC